LLVKKSDKNVKSVTIKTDKLVDITDCKDFETFKFEEPIKKKVEKKETIIQYEEEKDKQSDEEKLAGEEEANDNPFEDEPVYVPKQVDQSEHLNPFVPNDDASKVKILYRESIGTSLLYKAMARIYKKICYKERHFFYIIGPTLAIINQRIYTHKPLPFGDSFYANVIMKF